jgi:hypothetical protein
MGAPQYEQAGADIGGTGTTNTIPRWNPGPSTLGDSVIVQSGSVGLEAITISRASATNNALFVLSTPSGTTQQLFMRGGVSTEYFDFFRSNATGALHVQGNQTGFNNICLAPTSGNVGIGTASPSSYDAGARNLVVGSGTGNQGITIAGNGNLNLYFATGTTGGDPYRGYIRYTAAGDAFTFATASTVRASLGGSSLDISATSGYGLKLPATPGNADTQTLDCYQETTLNSGFTTSGITSTGTFTVTARATRIGRGIAITIRVAPSSGASLTFASGWTITLTGVPQMPSEGSLAVATSDTAVGRGSVLISDAATPILYGGTVGAYALAANVPLTVSGFIA